MTYRWGKPRKNVKRRDPRYFLDEVYEVGQEPGAGVLDPDKDPQEEANRIEEKARRHDGAAEEFKDMALGHTVDGDAGSDYTEEGRAMVDWASMHHDQAAILRRNAEALRSGTPGRQERGYGKDRRPPWPEELRDDETALAQWMAKQNETY